LGFGHLLNNTPGNEKKGLVLRPALKGSLNLMVSKGPEETTGGNTHESVSDELIMSGFSLGG
jgi:hypothetical protein